MRIGFGYDSHRFTAGDFITVGGVKIPFNKGVDAHSDGDVLLHALCDALLGAAALGDIGQHFPPSDPRYKNCDSAVFVRKILALLKSHSYQIVNIDATLIAKAPKFAPYILKMRSQVAKSLLLSCEQVSVKATTNEGMGWIGRGEGLAAQVVVLLACL